MTLALVSSLGRALRAGRNPLGARQACAAAAVALLLPAVPTDAQTLTPGSKDTSFNLGSIPTSAYALVYEQDVDGTPKITAGGSNGYGVYLQSDGIADPNFLFPVWGSPVRLIYTIVPEKLIPSGQTLPNLLMGGLFGRWTTLDNGLPRNIVRILPTGAMDNTFLANLGSGANDYVTSILPLDDGRIVVGGEFTVFKGEPRKRIVRLLNSGVIDESFATGSNIDDDVVAVAAGLDPASGLADGATIVAGIFNHVAGQTYGKLARLDPNGNLDMSFHPIIDLRVTALYVQPDGKILIGGDFTSVNGTAVSHIARLNYDGSLDTTFSCSVTGVPNRDVNPTSVYVFKALGDGRVYVGGEFAAINGVTRIYLGLINSDGSLDTSFDPGTAVYYSVQSIAIQGDYNILVGETLGPKIGKSYPSSIVRLVGVVPGSIPLATPVQNAVQPAKAATAVQKRAIRETRTAAPSSARTVSGLYIW